MLGGIGRPLFGDSTESARISLGSGILSPALPRSYGAKSATSAIMFKSCMLREAKSAGPIGHSPTITYSTVSFPQGAIFRDTQEQHEGRPDIR